MRVKKGNKLARLVIFIIILLVVVLSILFAIQAGFFDYFSDVGKKPQLFKIEGECALIFNRLIHSITDEGMCGTRCKTECGIRNLNFYNSEFSELNDSCNICNCYCK